MANILGLDYGERRIGVAVADERDLLAVGAGILTVVSDDDALQQLQALVHAKDVSTIVVGLPLSLRGTETEQTAAARRFAAFISGILHLPVVLQDERLTSAGARRRPDAPVHDDTGAAVLLLQSYIDQQRRRESHG